MAPLIRAFEAEPDVFEVKVCATAQHREMLDQVLELFEIRPDYDLNLMRPGQDLSDITAEVLLQLRNIFKEYQPDFLLVQGDTATTFAAALAGFYQKIAIGHVEAGLRTGDIFSPWPEEANRVLTGRLATLHFAPTERNKNDLIREHVSADTTFVTGNTVIDALQWVIEKIVNSGYLKRKVLATLYKEGLPAHVLTGRYVLVTSHRRENYGEGFEEICRALNKLAKNNSETHFIFPVHLNPNVQEPVNRLLGNAKNIHVVQPLSYEPFVYLMQQAHLILTDSGGVQEEAPGLGTPVLVMRDTTERPEAIEAGTVKLVGASAELIVTKAQNLLDDEALHERMSKAHNPYGRGDASKRIIQCIKDSKGVL